MSFLLNLLPGFRQDEMTAFFSSHITSANFSLNDDALREFKRLIIKHSTVKVDEKFYQALGQYDEAVQARVLIFFFMFLNWGSLAEIKGIFQHVKSRNLLSHKDKLAFKDEEDAHLFNFNKTFSNYIFYYMMDIKSIYTLRNGQINPKSYAKLILSGEIGFEGMFFFLRRFRLSNTLFENFNWLLTEKKEHTGFRYVAEVVTRQMIEEFAFVRNVFQELYLNYDQLAESKDFIRFLVFYEFLIWQNKAMKSIFSKFDWFFREASIKSPSLLNLSAGDVQKLDEALLTHLDDKDNLKFTINDSVTYEDLSKAGAESLAKINDVANRTDQNADMFSQKTILHKLNYENYPKVKVPEIKEEDDE